MQSKKISNILYRWLNDLSIRNKLILVYAICMFIPLILTDSVVFGLLEYYEQREEEYRMRSAADSVRYLVNSSFDEAVTAINKIYLDEDVYKFLDQTFESDYDFYEKRFRFNEKKIKPLDGGRESVLSSIILCSDNAGIVNGGNFYNLKDIKYISWEDLQASKSSIVVFFYYPKDEINNSSQKKKVAVIRMLDNYSWYHRNMMVYVDLDFSVLQRKMKAMTFEYSIYLCEGDRILLSSPLQKSINMDYETLGDDVNIGLEVPWNVYGRNLRIIVSGNESNFKKIFKDHAVIIILLIMLNLLAPIVVIRFMNKSFAMRLYRISRAFDEADIDNNQGINEENAGNDEIGLLIRGYNRMVERQSTLIRTNYTARLERQEMELARQTAELSALHSQINPHFLFNMLENIRMRSVIKSEKETASMIEKLATLIRQNVSWSTDDSTIEDEISFIKSYLELQKYRFGEKLKFEISVRDDCKDFLVPKLTLVTFVENACIHGMEGKTAACYIYVRVYRNEESLVMEIEDTGSGMLDEEVMYLNDKMNNCTLEDVKKGSHVGMLNACLRLRMSTDLTARFGLESEKGVGTYITITVPADRLKKYDDKSDVGR
ncbi:sensor histidine kinase [Butyrivibrio sp. AE3009]|uniref:sensor histidine kinase n=1 Tax=Butyrivibrio sp. AE3009 TaxID=1280666 RepID=UPI0003B3CC75|nr:histidine kinase [Butyrivibrio sp. AE3009]